MVNDIKQKLDYIFLLHLFSSKHTCLQVSRLIYIVRLSNTFERGLCVVVGCGVTRSVTEHNAFCIFYIFNSIKLERRIKTTVRTCNP